MEAQSTAGVAAAAAGIGVTNPAKQSATTMSAHNSLVAREGGAARDLNGRDSPMLMGLKISRVA
jgi:hypothetical protein